MVIVMFLVCSQIILKVEDVSKLLTSCRAQIEKGFFLTGQGANVNPGPPIRKPTIGMRTKLDPIDFFF